jgi:hypothetical protein
VKASFILYIEAASESGRDEILKMDKIEKGRDGASTNRRMTLPIADPRWKTRYKPAMSFRRAVVKLTACREEPFLTSE